jgi:intracellular sulfur oxidation DsrE/DsrF family protein
MQQSAFDDSLIVFTRRGLGDGDPRLTEKLAVNYLRTLLELQLAPSAIAFYGDGVRLVAEGSPCLDELRQLAGRGVRLLACRTCLDFYGLIDQVRVGEIGNMAMIVELQARCAKVIAV